MSTGEIGRRRVAGPLGPFERPRFYCGELLSDLELTSLVEWVRGKAKLVRFRDGWGVASGLDVRIDADRPGRVVVEPGYALTRDGEDVLVSEPARVDLASACGAKMQACDLPVAPEDDDPID